MKWISGTIKQTKKGSNLVFCPNRFFCWYILCVYGCVWGTPPPPVGSFVPNLVSVNLDKNLGFRRSSHVIDAWIKKVWLAYPSTQTDNPDRLFRCLNLYRPEHQILDPIRDPIYDQPSFNSLLDDISWRQSWGQNSFSFVMEYPLTSNRNGKMTVGHNFHIVILL